MSTEYLRTRARAAWESEIEPVLFKAVGIGSPMDSYSLLLEDLGRCFKCERCCRKADRNKLCSWKQLVTHFVDEYEQISWQESPEIIGWGNKLSAFYKTHDVHAPGSPIMILVTIPGMKFPLEY